MRKFAALALVFGCVFWGAGLALNKALREVLPAPYMGLLTEKIKAFDQVRNDVDIVFIGTSRTFHQVNTPLIETRLKAQGCGTAHVFNMGIPNLTFVELRAMLEHIYAAPTPRLKLVIIDEPMPAVRLELDRLSSDRVRYFSDWKGTKLRLQDIASDQNGLPKKIARGVIALLGFFYEQSTLGYLSRTVFPDLYAFKKGQDPEMQNMPTDWRPTKGYFSLEHQAQINETVRGYRAAFLKTLPEFSAQLEEQKTRRPKTIPIPVSPARMALFGEIFKTIEQHGQHAGLYLPPLPERVAENKALSGGIAESFPETALLYYNDPAAYPQFWDSTLWFDAAHLNDTGARMMSDILSEQLCSITSSWKGAPDALR